MFKQGTQDHDSAQQVPDHILSLFSSFDGFKFPTPHLARDVTQKHRRTPQKGQINQEFWDEIQLLRKNLESKLAPKRSVNEGEYVTGEGT